MTHPNETEALDHHSNQKGNDLVIASTTANTKGDDLLVNGGRRWLRNLHIQVDSEMGEEKSPEQNAEGGY